MDIIDVMLARAMTPQGKTDAYVAKANRAAQKAVQAEAAAEQAIATVTAAATNIENAQAAATQLLNDAQAALETAQAAQQTQIELYTTTGQNTDGTMTQKAITDALGQKADSSVLNQYATTQYVNNIVQNIPSGGGSASINFNPSDAGHLVMINEEGHLVPSIATEDSLVNALLDANSYTPKDAVGLDMDYANRLYTRTQQAINKSMGSDFDVFPMYGGRIKCNVADDGTINAFYGDNDYTEDGSNGQVMVYQPKFYYRRTPFLLEAMARGQIIRHESLMLSAIEQPGFKLAPAFKGELEYILLPAYDGSLANDKLASVAGATPLNNVTVAQAEAYATARGIGWHIMNMAAEATNQMLEIVEFGTMNGQTALEQGITYNPSNSMVCLFITGSTAHLGNGTGHANETSVNINGNISTVNSAGYRAITYRGMENPWGNLWQLIGGINVKGDGSSGGGAPYICTDFNYTPSEVGANYEDIGFNLPATYKWISAMGIGNTKYDWVFLPIECSQTATSLLPIGDSIWSTNGLNGINILASGGSYGYQEECGPFYYAADRNLSESSRANYGAKLLYIPQKDSIYTANVAKWQEHMEG